MLNLTLTTLFLRRVAQLSKDSSTKDIISALVSAQKLATRVPKILCVKDLHKFALNAY